ncbi:MAG: AI-2E family transporter, partial [Anaerolineae bacterium]
MGTDPGFGSAARFLLVAAAFVVVVAGMQAAAPLIAPFLLAVFIAVIAAPPMRALCRRGLPDWASLLVVVLGLVAAGMVVAVLVTGSLDGFRANLPEYQAGLKELTSQSVAWLNRVGLPVPEKALLTYVDPGKALGMAGDL